MKTIAHVIICQPFTDHPQFDGFAYTPEEIRTHARIASLRHLDGAVLIRWEDGVLEPVCETSFASFDICIAYATSIDRKAAAPVSAERALELKTLEDATVRALHAAAVAHNKLEFAHLCQAAMNGEQYAIDRVWEVLGDIAEAQNKAALDVISVADTTRPDGGTPRKIEV